MPALLQAADEAIIVFIERLQSSLHALRQRVLEPGASSSGQPAASETAPTTDGEAQPAEALQLAQESAAVLPMLNVAGKRQSVTGHIPCLGVCSVPSGGGYAT